MSTNAMSTQSVSTKRARSTRSTESGIDEILVDFASPDVQEELRYLVPPLPESAAARSEWLHIVAREATLSVAQARALGAQVSALDEAFSSLLTGEPGTARLTRSGTEIVCHDRSVPGTLNVYSTLPELLASQVAHTPTKLKPNQHVGWRIRLLAKAELIDLPPVGLPTLPAQLTPEVHLVYNGLRLLFACRWYLEPGEPVPFSAAFICTWCGVSRWHAQDARDALRRHGIIREVAEVPSGKPFATKLFLPGEGS